MSSARCRPACWGSATSWTAPRGKRLPVWCADPSTEEASSARLVPPRPETQIPRAIIRGNAQRSSGGDLGPLGLSVERVRERYCHSHTRERDIANPIAFVLNETQPRG